MTLRKNSKINLATPPGVTTSGQNDLLNKGKSVEEIIKERGIKPIKDESDFERIFGNYKEWFNVDAFLKEAHRPWK
jgi:hypothetical protein